MTLQADLAEATMLRQRQEETLRLRERELTALKGALKEEVECHDKEMEALREQYTQDMDNLRSTMEEFTQVRGNVFSQYTHAHRTWMLSTSGALQTVSAVTESKISNMLESAYLKFDSNVCRVLMHQF